MTPAQIINNILKTDPNTGNFILAGLAVFAAAAIVISFKLDIDYAVTIIAYLLAFAVIARFLASIEDPVMTKVLGRTITAIFTVYLCAILTSAALPGKTPLAPVECMIKFWKNCPAQQDLIANSKAPEVPVSAEALAAKVSAETASTTKPGGPVIVQGTTTVAQSPSLSQSVDRKKYTVTTQFAGYRREDVTVAAIALLDVGWRVQGAEKGGERVESAAGTAEVRYGSDADAAAAQQLANEVSATGIKANVKARKVTNITPPIQPGALEVWIGL